MIRQPTDYESIALTNCAIGPFPVSVLYSGHRNTLNALINVHLSIQQLVLTTVRMAGLEPARELFTQRAAA